MDNSGKKSLWFGGAESVKLYKLCLAGIVCSSLIMVIGREAIAQNISSQDQKIVQRSNSSDQGKIGNAVVNSDSQSHSLEKDSPLNTKVSDKSAAIIESPVDSSSSLSVSSKYFSSGIYPAINDETAPVGIGERYGDFAQQTQSVIGQLADTLDLAGLTILDLVQIRVYIVADNNGQYNDVQLQKALRAFLDGHKPAISVLGVNELNRPEQLLAVEFSAVYPSGKSLKSKSNYPLANTMVKPLASAYSNSSLGVAISPNASLYVMAGLVADPLRPDLAPTDVDYMGNTQQQASAVLEKIQRQLNQQGLSMRDVIYIRSFLAPDASGYADFDGWELAYSQAFNTLKNPNKPARTTISVKPGFAAQGRLVEIEAIAVFPDPRGVFTYYDIASPNKMLRSFFSRGRVSRAVAVARHASLHWLSGALAENTGLSMAAQALDVMKQLELALYIKGLGWKDVVALRAYLDVKDDFDNNFAAWNRVYDQFFINSLAPPHKPARTVTPVNYLPGGAMVEVELLVIEPE